MGYNGIEAAKMGLGIPQPTAYLNLSIAVRSPSPSHLYRRGNFSLELSLFSEPL